MEVTIPLKSDIWETVTRNLLHHIIFKQYSSFWFCHRIICSEIWAYWIITDLVHRSFCSSSEWWLRGIRLTWEFYYCKLNFLMLWCSQMLCCCSHCVRPVAYLPRQSAHRRSVGISKDYSSSSSTSLLYLQCFVQTHLIVPFIHCSFLLYGLRPPVSQCKVITFLIFSQ